MTAPDRIWIAPTHRSNGVDDFYLLDPKYRGNRGTDELRADIVAELVEALEVIAGSSDDDGFTSDGHERCTEIALTVLAKLQDGSA